MLCEHFFDTGKLTLVSGSSFPFISLYNYDLMHRCIILKCGPVDWT